MEENAIALLKNNVDLDGWMAVEGVKYLLNIVVIAMTSSIIFFTFDLRHSPFSRTYFVRA